MLEEIIFGGPTLRTCSTTAFCLLVALTVGTSPGSAAGAPAKRAVAAARLLLPFFEIDTTDSDGASTLFSIRNETIQATDVRISYHATDRPQTSLHSETVTLPGKRVLTFDIRSTPNLLIDGDGFARGFVIVEALSEGAVIQGDYFQITSGEDFATGNRLVNIDPESVDNDLCSVFTLRFLNGGGFDGGTDFIVWLDLDLPPADTTVLSYTVYNEAGVLRFFTDLAANQVAFKVKAADLVAILPTNFGAVEFQLSDGIRGHISAVMSALGRYSVGLEAACLD